ncbi:MAG: glucose PTS transporter subunit EIIB, partial [Haemophilus parainfluenzae]|nr:glucose PTS transporter subunit EIIB [Haemophilus parainfluenzae]
MNFPQIAQQVIDKLGGKDNIATAAHCATRLRIVLNDESKVDKEGIDNIEGVKGQFAVAGQYQIIFGSGTVNKVHAELTKLLGIGDVSKAEVAEAASGNQNLLQRLVKGLADIFVPIIPAIVAGGLLMGIHSMLTAKGFFVDELSVIDMHPGLADLVDFINTIANAPFVFLPVLLGFSATRKFGGNPFLGAALGMLLVHPALADGWNYALTLAQGKIQYWNVFGLEIEKVGYQGTVIPTLVSAWVLATLEKTFR